MKVNITPEHAQRLLLLNTKNRKVSKTLVASYAADMLSGRWCYNGDPIRVSATNVLLDGQHRLLAVVASGVTIESELIEGLPDAVHVTIDGGRKRSAADVINLLNGTSIATGGIAASARQTLNYLAGAIPTTRQSTPAIVQLLDAYPEIIDRHHLARSADKIIPAGALGAVLFLGTRAVGMDKTAQRFVDPLRQGEGLATGDPRLSLRNAFINARRQSRAGFSVQWSLVVIINAWNAYATGQELKLAKAVPGKDGRLKIGDIAGGPTFGSGIDALNNFRLSLKTQKAMAIGK